MANFKKERYSKLVITPISDSVIGSISVGNNLLISGYIYAGRDAVLPRLVKLVNENKLEEWGIDLQGAVIFHTAVSLAGVGPTSSNKLEIESTIPILSKAGVKIHIGKGRLSQNTLQAMQEYNSVYAVVPPVTALLESRITEKKIVAFPEEGMEALHLLRVEGFPCIIAAAHGKTIFGL